MAHGLTTGQRVFLRCGALLCAALAVGCGDNKQATTSGIDVTASEGTSSGTAAEETTTDDGTSTGPTTVEPTTVDPTVTPTTDGTTESPTTTDEPPTTEGSTTTGGPVGGECDPLAQDCPEGAKCTAYGLKEGDEWNANKCVQVGGEGVAGDDCQVDAGESIFSGLDNCAAGYICLNTDMNGQNGFCVEFCNQDMACPNTSGGEGLCIPANEGKLPICLATCDPLQQDCPGNQGCYGDLEGPPFICFSPDTGDNTGMDGSTCEFTNSCLPGFFCGAAGTVDGCDPQSTGCCTPFCAIDEGDGPCAEAESCVPFFADPPPGTENVGVCVLP